MYDIWGKQIIIKGHYKMDNIYNKFIKRILEQIMRYSTNKIERK